MKYFVLTDDELWDSAEECIYVFEHTKKERSYTDIYSLEDFAAKCEFIECSNAHIYWYKGKNVEDLPAHELENKIKAKQKALQNMPNKDFLELKSRFSDTISPFVFPDNPLRYSYAYEPDWNDIRIVMECEDKFFALYYWTTA